MSAGPATGLFKRFQKAWVNIDISKYVVEINDLDFSCAVLTKTNIVLYSTLFC